MRPRQPSSTHLLMTALIMVLCGLGWLSYQTQKNARVVLAHQEQNFIENQLQTAEAAIVNYIQQLETQLVADYRQFNLNTIDFNTELRPYLSQSLIVNFIYLANAEGERLFPVKDLVSNREMTFLKNTEELWTSPSLFSVISKEENLQSAQSNLRKSENYIIQSRQKIATSLDRGIKSGWINWYGQSYIFWIKDPQNNLIAFNLVATRFISDIINRLPDDTNVKDIIGNASMRLLDDRNHVIYQWGSSAIEDDQQASEYRYLPMPFRSWKLEFYQYSSLQAGSWLQSLLGSIALALVLAFLFYYLNKEQQRELREASQRVTFVNQVSHELKTPLTNVRMYAELLEGELLEDDIKPRKYLNVILGESVRLSRLIENVLNFSRSQKDKIKINKTKGNINQCIKLCLSSFEESFSQHGIEVNFKAEATGDTYFDQGALEQILTNLLSNAEKYAHDGKKIDIHSQLLGNKAKISVRDFGKAIPKQEQKRIFEPFYRVSSKLTDGVSGTGIGLSIAQELARLHGGDIKLTVLNPGCCFTVELDITHTQTS